MARSPGGTYQTTSVRHLYTYDLLITIYLLTLPGRLFWWQRVQVCFECQRGDEIDTQTFFCGGPWV